MRFPVFRSEPHTLDDRTTTSSRCGRHVLGSLDAPAPMVDGEAADLHRS
jgi:hypothetical protein